MNSSRRSFLGRTVVAGSVAALAPSLGGLVSRIEGQAVPRVRRAIRGNGGYGSLAAAGPVLALPEGFRYWVISERGQPMSNGQPTPGAFDGMAAFPLPNGNIRLIRNHESRDTPANSRVKGDPARARDTRGGGGTTSLEVAIGPDGRPELVRDFMSLNGTIINCAGGPTPWGSWLSCEETVAGPVDGWSTEHGYIFEVPVGAESEVEAVPLKAMGRFVHEAVAVDPKTGIVYETEDRQTAGFYRFTPDVPGKLQEGGKLEMLAVKGRPRFDTRTGQRIGARMAVEWVPIADPDPTPKDQEDALLVYSQGHALGGATFARLEGCWPGDGGIFFHATNGGDAKHGQVWFYRPGADGNGMLSLLFESPAKEVLDCPDNITVSPRGGIVICEDGGGEQHLRGLTPDGRIFDFAKNVLNNTEFAGACFSPDGETLFVNIMGSTTDAGDLHGVTVAIRGPWADGAL